MAIENRRSSPVREKPQKPLYAEVHKQLETFHFREPYRIGEVQSLGEKRAFRRIIGRLRRSGVQTSNEKPLLLWGLIANKFARRIHGFGQAGGGRATGIQPSPGRSGYFGALQRQFVLAKAPKADSLLNAPVNGAIFAPDDQGFRRGRGAGSPSDAVLTG